MLLVTKEVYYLCLNWPNPIHAEAGWGGVNNITSHHFKFQDVRSNNAGQLQGVATEVGGQGWRRRRGGGMAGCEVMWGGVRGWGLCKQEEGHPGVLDRKLPLLSRAKSWPGLR